MNLNRFDVGFICGIVLTLVAAMIVMENSTRRYISTLYSGEINAGDMFIIGADKQLYKLPNPIPFPSK